MTPTPWVIPTEVIEVDAVTSVLAWLEVFAPIVTIGVSISLAMVVLHYIGKWIVSREYSKLSTALKSKSSPEPKQDERNERVEQLARLFSLFLDHVAGEPIKPKNDHKPKRKNDDQPTFYIGDDGELIEDKET